ncbi:D-alanyl-D-alanine carboxypeptidase family protein [Kitasatospora sp. NBC_00315]|uniref:D-alanyl-D-alanine carboxypeptidase family protein n=1 Tax=Kitasatospora sp. NBC_00315 TaxID=2975963 RepID=UPI003250FCC9
MGRSPHSYRSPVGPRVAAAAVAAVLSAATGAPARAADLPPLQPPPGMSAAGGERLALPGVQAEPSGASAPPELSALSWMVSDLGTGEVLAAKNAHWPLPPASTLKALFADTLLPRLSADAVHRVSAADLSDVGEGSSRVGIQAGQSYKVSDLWLGVFLRSGNDAVRTLAAMSGGVPAAVGAMQARATALGALDTHVVSPDGYDAPGQVSSAYDLTLILRDALANPDFARYSTTRVATFPGGRTAKGTPAPSFQIQNTNRLLAGTGGVPRYPGLIAGKNGYTAQAGNTLISAASRDGHTLAVALLNPRSGKPNAVYEETRQLLDWGFAARGEAAAVGALTGAAALPTAAGPAQAPSRRPWLTAGRAAGLALPVLAVAAVVALRRRRVRGVPRIL